MIQETRKDPRAKVLSMTVRYKSATLDEFIEHHSHDISRGGMFIKTPAPFPGGTLLKFEVRIADEQKVVQGVGRVVWKRDAASASPDTPAGMGVKFIKLDDESKQLIDRLIAKRGNAEGAYDTGERTSGDNVPTSPQPTSSMPGDNRPIPIRKGTMIGLGAMKPGSAPAPATEAPAATKVVMKTPPPPASDGGFFPKSEPLVQQPIEDQTVMRQAAELLRDAIREAGGSLDELGTAGATPVVALPEPESGRIIAPTPMFTGDVAKRDSSPAAAKVDSAPPAATSKSLPPTSSKSSESSPVSARPAAKSTSVPPASTGSRRPLPRSPAVPPDSRHPSAQGTSKSGLWMLVGVAALGFGIFFFAQRNKPEAVSPEPSATPAAVAPTPEPSMTASAATPEPSASAAPPETAAEKVVREKAEAEAAKKAEADAKKAEADAKKAEADAKKAADAEAKKAAAAAQKADLEAKRAAAAEALRAAHIAAAHAAAVMKPAAKPPTAAAPTDENPTPTPAPTTEPTAAAPTATAEKPTPPAAAAPTTTAAPTASSKPKAAPAKPAAPAPKGGESDNPY